MLHCLQQPWLDDLTGALFNRPVAQTHHHDRKVWQFHDGPDAEGVEQLARPEVADFAFFRGGTAHGCSSSSASVSSLTAATNSGSSSSPPSWKMRPTVGSTSRSELRQVKSSQGSRPGRRKRPTVTPSRSSS